MHQVVLQVDTLTRAPGRETIIASGRMLEGEPRIGSRLNHAARTGAWEVVGFAHVPPPVDPTWRTFDLLLRPIDSASELREGDVLVAQLVPLV